MNLCWFMVWCASRRVRLAVALSMLVVPSCVRRRGVDAVNTASPMPTQLADGRELTQPARSTPDRLPRSSCLRGETEYPAPTRSWVNPLLRQLEDVRLFVLRPCVVERVGILGERLGGVRHQLGAPVTCDPDGPVEQTAAPRKTGENMSRGDSHRFPPGNRAVATRGRTDSRGASSAFPSGGGLTVDEERKPRRSTTEGLRGWRTPARNPTPATAASFRGLFRGVGRQETSGGARGQTPPR